MNRASRPAARRTALAKRLLLAALALGAAGSPLGAGALNAPAKDETVRAAAQITLKPVALYGGDIRSLIFDPAAPDRLFAGSSGGHVYRSDDGGTTWVNAGAEIPFPGWVVGTLAFDPDPPGGRPRLWAGLWGVWGGGLVAQSDDLGATWELRPLGEFARDQVYALARPAGSTKLLLGTRAGLLLSEDLGKSFRAVGRDVAGLTQVSSLYADPARPRQIVAGTWRRAYRSADGGATWTGAFDGMVLDTEVFSLSGVPGRDGELWASSCGWVYHGESWGERWSRRQVGLDERRTPAFRVLSPDRLLAGTVAGAYLSTDGGQSFRRTSRSDLSVLAIAHHPARPERIAIGTEGAGVWISNDGGESFSARSVGQRNVRVTALASVGDQLFAALAHAGPASGVYRSPDGGVSFEPTPSELPTVLELAAAEHRLYAATELGLFERDAEGWKRSASPGEKRIDELSADGARVVLRAGSSVYEADAGGAPKAVVVGSPRGGAGQAPRSLALAAGELWVLREDGLFRIAGGSAIASAKPFAGGSLLGAGHELYYYGSNGLYRRDAPTGAWVELGRSATRLVATGDARFAFLALRDGALALFDREQEGWRAVATPFPPEETLAAHIVGERLLVGTSGYGLWEGRVPE